MNVNQYVLFAHKNVKIKLEVITVAATKATNFLIVTCVIVQVNAAKKIKVKKRLSKFILIFFMLSDAAYVMFTENGKLLLFDLNMTRVISYINTEYEMNKLEYIFVDSNTTVAYWTVNDSEFINYLYDLNLIVY